MFYQTLPRKTIGNRITSLRAFSFQKHFYKFALNKIICNRKQYLVYKETKKNINFTNDNNALCL